MGNEKDVRVKLYLYHEWHARDKEIKLGVWDCKVDNIADHSGRYRVFIREVEIDFTDIPSMGEREQKEMTAACIRQEMQTLQADTHMKLMLYEERLQELLCIENAQ